jgi:hypothetical protein
MNRIFLLSGVLSSLWYLAINVIVPMHYEGYDVANYTVSELSAIGAPTRSLWVSMCFGYVILFGMFGVGILKTGKNDRKQKILGVLVMAYTIFNFYWPPMHQRGETPTLTDTLHLVWASVTTVMMMLIMGYGAAIQGKNFRIYTIVTAILLLTFGTLTSLDAPKIPDNLPTPMLGVWERIMIAMFMLWVAILSVMLRKDQKNATAAAT